MSVDFNIDAAIAKIEQLVVAHGPAAVETAARVVHYNAISTFVHTGMYALVAAVLSLVVLSTVRSRAAAYRVYKEMEEAYQKDRCTAPYPKGEPDSEELGWMIMFGVVATLLWIFVLLRLSDVWTWVGLLDPKMALAREIVAKVL